MKTMSTTNEAAALYAAHLNIIQLIQSKWPIKTVSYNADDMTIKLECDTICFTISDATYEISTRTGPVYQPICAATSLKTFSRAVEEFATIQAISCAA
jgi:hypothetical protein